MKVLLQLFSFARNSNIDIVTQSLNAIGNELLINGFEYSVIINIPRYIDEFGEINNKPEELLHNSYFEKINNLLRLNLYTYHIESYIKTTKICNMKMLNSVNHLYNYRILSFLDSIRLSMILCSDFHFDINILCRIDHIHLLNINYLNLKNIVNDNKIYCINIINNIACEDKCFIIKSNHLLIYKQFFDDFKLLFNTFNEVDIYPEKLIKIFISRYGIEMDYFNNVINLTDNTKIYYCKYSSEIKEYITKLYIDIK